MKRVFINQVFETPIVVEEITSNGLPVLSCTPENNPSAFLWYDRVYITDDSLYVRGLVRGMNRKDVLHTVGFSQYGVDLCDAFQDISIRLEDGVCTEFNEISFLDIDEAIIIEISTGANTVGLLLGFENDELTHLECDLPI